MRGGRVLGATDDKLIGVPVDLRTGLADDGGVQLGCEHLGTALLALGGLDPAEHLPGVDVLEGLLA